ncbi:MAG TPA: NAD(P)-dependent oxidoreductase, partial [Planctomycetaceae bacterium]|nr:NAD(P)-dependent oxidoreductase [Planctomycetaceae bacterium]
IGFDIDLQRCQELVDQGAETVAAPTDVCQQCRTIFLSLPDSKIVEQLIATIQPHLQPGDIILDTTTGDPQQTRSISRQLAGDGVTYLDTTMVGSSIQVRSLEGLMLIGGESAAVSRCQLLINAVSKQSVYLGPSGSGATMKLIVNLVLGLNRAVLAEGLALAESCGLELQQVLDILNDSPAYSSVMERKGPKMVQEDFVPQARLAQHLKDVHLILQLGSEQRQPLLLSEVHQSLLQRAVSLGYAEADNSAIIMASRCRESTG